MKILTFTAAMPFLAGCFVLTHTGSVNQDGIIEQSTCVEDDCHTLYGAGSITFDPSSESITVQCQNQKPFQYDPTLLKGYNCLRRTPVFK